MRLEAITLDGFRGFGSRQEFDLGADATIIVGANGQGKTSLFDGILWALTGTIPRFSTEASVLSLWSQTGQAQVELALSNAEVRLDVIRQFDGEVTTLALRSAERTIRGPEAESELLRVLWADGLAATDPQQALCAALERGTYLQQDLVTQFIAADSPQERFAAISELVGSGRIRELQEALERARRAWSAATNTQTREREDLAQGVSTLRAHIAQLGESAPDSTGLESDWVRWWESYRAFTGDVSSGPSLGPDASSLLDKAIRELQRQAIASQQTHAELNRTVEMVAAVPPRPLDDVAALSQHAQEAEDELKAAELSLASAREQVATLRRQYTELQERRQAMATFASLALEQLGDHCPVCGQDYDRAHTVAHLQKIVAESGDSGPTVPTLDVSGQAAVVEGAERRLADARAAVEAATHRLSAWEAQGATARAAVSAFGFEITADVTDRLQQRAEQETKRAGEAATLRGQGEQLTLRVTRLAEQARRVELQSELETREQALAEADAALLGRRRTGDVASAIIDGLREASANVVAARLADLGPLIERFFSTADPHPAFRYASLQSSFKRGAGLVTPSLSDPTTSMTTDLPHEYMSSSQVNVLAVSVFLALNLGMPSLPITAAILDDPLQSLDDLNLLGLVDLLRRLRLHRQLLISTHEERFAQLLERKLRPVGTEQRTRVIRFESWQREGPTVRAFDVKREDAPLRLVA